MVPGGTVRPLIKPRHDRGHAGRRGNLGPHHLERGGMQRVDQGVLRLAEEQRVVDRERLVVKGQEDRGRDEERGKESRPETGRR